MMNPQLMKFMTKNVLHCGLKGLVPDNQATNTNMFYQEIVDIVIQFTNVKLKDRKLSEQQQVEVNAQKSLVYTFADATYNKLFVICHRNLEGIIPYVYQPISYPS